jgi:ring-1,2-phenylacetyl-CoA epoxidase subunit PaaD
VVTLRHVRASGQVVSTEEIWALLDQVMDPEVPVLSVVELGIVRDVRVDADVVTVVITPTYSGCPAMHVIEQDIVSGLAAHGIAPVRLETVFSPAWTTDWMSDEAKAKLVAYGIAAPGKTERDDGLVTLTRRGAVACPYCRSTNTTLKSEFGSTACKSIHYCASCKQPFEGFKPI